jgi:hypothetical protein
VLEGEKDGVMIAKPGHLMTDNTYYGHMSHPSCSQHQAGLCLVITQGSLKS